MAFIKLLNQKMLLFSIQRSRTLLTSFCNPLIQTHSLCFSSSEIDVDLKPPEEPEYCCGNGCQNCVWNAYFIEMETYRQKKERLEELRRSKNLASVETSAIQDDGDVGGAGDVGMRAFLALEQKLKHKD